MHSALSYQGLSSCHSHVDGIVSKAWKRVFLIYQLKRAGIGQCDLVRIYISVIRPVVVYACPAWHTNLPKYVSDNIELIQKRYMKILETLCDLLYECMLNSTIKLPRNQFLPYLIMFCIVFMPLFSLALLFISCC